MDHVGTAIVLILAMATQVTWFDLVFILVVGSAWSACANRAILQWRDALSLANLLAVLHNEKVAIRGVYRVQDYAKEISRPNENGRPLSGFTILHIPKISPTAYLYDARRSYIVFPFSPAEMNPVRAFALYHEIGHSGLRNYLAATTEALNPWQKRSVDDIARGILRRIRLVFTNRRIARAFFRLLPRRLNRQWFGYTAVAPMFIFIAPEGHAAAYFLGPLIAICSGSLNRAGLRMEAEIEADHFAVSQLMSDAIARGTVEESRHPLFATRFRVPNDPDLVGEANLMRLGAFEWMRYEARQSVHDAWRSGSGKPSSISLKPLWFFRWRMSGLQEAAFTIPSLLALGIITWAMVWFGVSLKISHWGAMLAVVFPLAALLLTARRKSRRLAEINLRIAGSRSVENRL